MNTRRLLTVTVSAMALLTGFHTLRAEAQGVILQQQGGRQGNFQGNRGAGRQQQQPGNFQGNHGQVNALAMQSAERLRRVMGADPSHSAANYLLSRNDVRSELGITTRQREALEELNKKAPGEMVDRFRNSDMLKKLQDRTRELRNLPAGERQAQQAKIREEMRASGDQIMADFQNYQSELDQRAEEILTPEQLKRLHELDLQYRGGLALSEQKRAIELEITPAQSQKIAVLMQEFHTRQSALMAEATGTGERIIRPDGPQAQNGNQASAGGQPGTLTNPAAGNTRGRVSQDGRVNQRPPVQASRPIQIPNPQEMQAKMTSAQAEIDKLRKTLGAKVIAELDPEQAAYWKTLLGRPFTFRVVD